MYDMVSFLVWAGSNEVSMPEQRLLTWWVACPDQEAQQVIHDFLLGLGIPRLACKHMPVHPLALDSASIRGFIYLLINAKSCARGCITAYVPVHPLALGSASMRGLYTPSLRQNQVPEGALAYMQFMTLGRLYLKH